MAKRYLVIEQGVTSGNCAVVFGDNKNQAIKMFSNDMGIDFKFTSDKTAATHTLVEDKDYRNYNFSKFSGICPSNKSIKLEYEGQKRYFKNTKIRNEDGSLKEVYHFTNEKFNSFSLDKVIKWPGFWFSEDYDYASSHGRYGVKVYLNLKNPFDCEKPENDDFLGKYMKKYGNGQESCLWTKEFRNYLIKLGYDGMCWKHDGAYTYVAFYPNQIRSAENRNPETIDRLNWYRNE